jgi:GT2 family glycosyltransferase
MGVGVNLPAPTVDVVIPTHGRWDLTETCLRHLAAQTVFHTVYLVDNGSPDNTAANVRRWFPAVRLIELGDNLGFPVACNQGVAAGESEVVVLLNNDVQARPDFVEKLIRPFGEPRVATATPVLLQPGGKTIDCVGLCADSTLAGFPRLRGRPVAEATLSRPALAGPCGGGAAYRRSVWEQVGGLDEGVRFYGEDVDLALRISAAGWQSAYALDSIAVHLGSATAGERSSWQRYQGGFSRGYFIRRYGTLRTRASFRTVAAEGIVVCGDAVISRDLSAFRGRMAGLRAGRDSPRHSKPPTAAVDDSIGFIESLRLRRSIYA